jgi:exodeoxyribonuclease VII small subunit
MTQPPTGNTPPTFEASLAQLQQIVNDLEEGHLGLETSLARFEEGIRLLRSCYTILEAAEQKIEILAGLNEAGEPVTEPFDASATFEGDEKPARKPGRRRSAAKEQPKADDSLAGFEPPEREEGGLF